MGDVNFDRKDKVTKPGGEYQECDSGYAGNFSEKDASVKRMNASNKMGQVVCHYTGNQEVMYERTGGGQTAYEGLPVAETYKCATSKGSPGQDAVVRPVKKVSN
jgi:hypothetical protein